MFEVEATINLSNYENIRVRVECDTMEKSIAALDAALLLLGRCDEHMSACITSYRDRVLKAPVEEVHDECESTVEEVAGGAPVERAGDTRETAPKEAETTCAVCGAVVGKPQMRICDLFLKGKDGVVYKCKSCFDQGGKKR